jgi:DNA-binding XRE family transcriptional regulator
MSEKAVKKIPLMTARKICGYTQDQAAEAIGTSNGSVARWENDNSTMPAKRFAQMAELYKTPINEIYIGRLKDYNNK